jgi:flagellar biosynthesis protein FlhG
MFESRADQASGLRRLFSRRDLRVLPVVVDPCDAQHSTFVVNLAAALSRIGRRTLLLDGDRAMIAAQLGLKARYDLLHVISGEFRLHDVAMQAADGFWVLPAARALAQLVRERSSPAALFGGFARLAQPFDTVLACAGAEIVAPLMAREGKEVVLVCGTGAEDVALLYARLKSLCKVYGLTSFRVFYNRTPSTAAAADCHERLAGAAGRFLGVQVRFGGAIEEEGALTLAERSKATVFGVAPASEAARTFERIATRSLDWPVPVYGGTEAVLH